MYHTFFIHSSVDGHLDCFHILAIVNSAKSNMLLRGLFVEQGWALESGKHDKNERFSIWLTRWSWKHSVTQQILLGGSYIPGTVWGSRDSSVNKKGKDPGLSSVQSLSRVRLFATPWIAARQASLSITTSHSLLKPMSIESVMPSSHLILCRPHLLPPVPPSIRVFSNESTLWRMMIKEARIG